ncbi:MAG: hypothetical protein IRZ16_09560 [Myxococcaceae bacterium]|nr:hypothetical protein [Myxococcaceae bacterium]
MSVLPLRDNWVHPEHGAPLRELATHAKVRLVVISEVDAYEEDYTHLSVLQGDAAPQEVFPLIATFLSGRPDGDAPALRTAKGAAP